MKFHLLISVAFLGLLCEFCTGDSAVEKAFRNYEIVPDLLDVAPSEIVEVTFTNTNKEVDLGNILAPKDVQEKPEIYYKAHSNTYYTLILTEPDEPRRKNPIQKEWLAWMVVNIPGSEVENGETLTEYVGAVPIIFTEFHRFVFLVYEQPSKLDFDGELYRSNTNGVDRIKFSTKRFTKKYDLGDPIAGNFFQAEYDDSVPATIRKMAFRASEVIPDITNVAPVQKLEVKYLGSNAEVNLGNELAPKQVLEVPEVLYNADSDSYYTLLMLGPDIPTRQFQFLGEWLHWLMVNIPGSNIAGGETLRQYMEAGPLPFTGLHRFIFLVYKQPSRLTMDEPYSSNNYVLSRPFFSTRRFVQKYSLGDPVAGNFFLAQYDDSVPSILYKVLMDLKIQAPQFVADQFLNVQRLGKF